MSLESHRHCHHCKRVFFLDELKEREQGGYFLEFKCPDCGTITYIPGEEGKKDSLRKNTPT